MNRPVIILLLAVATAAPLIARAAPPLTSEEVLRERVHKFTKAMLNEKYDEAVTYVDPKIVAQHGRDKVKDTGKHLMNLIRSVNETHWRRLSGFRIRKVEFASDKQRAVVDLHYFATPKYGGDRQEHPGDQHWVLRDNVWYLTNK